MSSSYAPSGDAQFDQWLANFNTALAAHHLQVGLTSADADTLEALVFAWDGKYDAHVAAHVAAKTATAGKNDARAAVMAAIRSMVARIQSYPGTTDELREMFGLRPRGASTSGSDLTYQDRPVADIDINERLTHNVKVYTMTPNGVKRAKPAGVLGCEVVRKIGDPPASIEEMETVGLMTKTTFAIEYPGSDAGKTVHYAMRWIHRDGTPGAWGETETATIAA